MMRLYYDTGYECSKIITKKYSTSFASAIRLLHPDLRQHVYNIYGFVRLADEVVDTFHDYNKQALLDDLQKQTFEAIRNKISLNVILQSFQTTVNEYGIDKALISAFFRSMYFDLDKNSYDSTGYQEYIYGSAEAVGLMCLYVFCEGNEARYHELKQYAQRLGAAFQKVNFLRDMSADNRQLNRMYFPGCNFINFSQTDKLCIEKDIEQDFKFAYKGIQMLPAKAKFGVLVAYKYYCTLFKKIKNLPLKYIMEERVRIPDFSKILILAKAGLRLQLNIL